jgi:hypothetical protein
MDAKVSAKFFRINKPAADAANPDTVLRNLLARELSDREIGLGEGVTLRLEQLEQEATYLAGEFCRIQTENIPPSAGPDGLIPTVLENGRGLGHLAAFRYHIPTRLLLLQINQLCATPNRVSLYLGSAEGKPLYVLDPVLRRDVLARVGKAEVRAFTVKFAEPENIDALDDASLSAIQGVKHAAQLLHATEIEITVAAGPKKKKKKRPHMLQQPVRRILAKLSKTKDVKSLKAQITEDDVAEWVDLLEEQMKYKEVFELPSGNCSPYHWKRLTCES